MLTQGAPARESIDMSTVLLSAILLLSVLIWMWSAPRGPFVLVVAAPASSEQQTLSIITEAGGSFISDGGYTWLAIAHSDAPSFPARLKKAGAFLVLNANIFSICSQENFNERS